jgi:ADP-ribose pyrophosphatase
MQEEVVFQTPWFRLLARRLEDIPGSAPHYSLQTPDFVSIIARDRARGLILVRQFRPAISDFALELPGGHVDAGQSPQESAANELWEETGFRAGTLELLGCMRPDVGRMTNRLWCFWADNPVHDDQKVIEAGHEVVFHNRSLGDLFSSGLDNCYSLACIWLAVARGKLAWDR